MRAVCIAVGNPLRGDDGVAYRVLDLLEPAIDVALVRAHQLAPELSEEIARAGNVIIIDADVNAGAPYIEPIAPPDLRGSPLAHVMTPAEVVRLAARLFGFDGAAFVCHVPAFDFDCGERLSPGAEANARQATQMVGRLCTDLRHSQRYSKGSTPLLRENASNAVNTGRPAGR